MRICFLADRPDLVRTISGWIFGEWGHLTPGSSLEKVETRFQTHLNRKSIPLTLVALDRQTAVGTASLVMYDIRTRNDLSPWLAGVYVIPEYRRKGIGTKLVQEAEKVTGVLLIRRLYLFTPDREAFYARLDWKAVETMQYRGQQVVIMVKDFIPGTQG